MRRIALIPTVAAALIASVAVTVPSRAQGRPFRSADEARQWLSGHGIEPRAGSLLIFLSGDDPQSVDVMRAYVALGLPLDGPGGDELSPLTLITRSCVGNAMAPQTTAVLIAAGASPVKPAPDGDKSTPLMEAVNCPGVLRAMLARKIDLNAVDGRGYTVMHHALASHEARDESARIVREAGFDVPRWSASLMKEFGTQPDAIALLAGVPVATTDDLPNRGGAIDWTAVGPYPSRSRAEAAKLLSRPGADTTVDDHFWDGIKRRQPQRLALALQAGANVRAFDRGTNNTALMAVADFCDAKQPELQQSIVDQLVAAKADPSGVNSAKANALILGARNCPVGVLRSMIAAGVPVSGADSSGTTALKSAILAGRADVVAVLIDAGVDPRKEPYNTGRLAAGNKAVEEALKRRPKP